MSDYADALWIGCMAGLVFALGLERLADTLDGWWPQ